MRVAIINQFSSAGGGARFVRALVFALADTFADMEITLFADWSAAERDGLDSLFSGVPNVSIRTMCNRLTPQSETRKPKLWKLRQVAKRIQPLTRAYQKLMSCQAKPAPSWFDYMFDQRTLAELAEFDVVHLAWPYFVEPVEIDAPVVATMHDFNYKYPFGNFSDSMLVMLEVQTPRWLDIASDVVVSSDFMRTELEKFYPDASLRAHVIRLTHFSISRPTDAEVAAILRKYQLVKPFIVCASNTSRHKNLEAALRAAAELKRRGTRVPLVIAGGNTHHIGRYAGSNFPADHPLFDFERLTEVLNSLGLVVGEDILPLGYVSDIEIDALIGSATLIVAPSLYEAGSGPAVDAWSVGTPVAFSDIPAFREHLDFLGVEALLFDPCDPGAIADVLEGALADPAGTSAMATRSQAAIEQYSWAQVAESYREVYQSAIDSAATLSRVRARGSGTR